MLWVLGMAIYARPADTRSSLTLIGWILPSQIKNRVGSGFLQKPNSTHLKLKLPKKTIYIYSYIYKLIKPYLSFHSSTQSPHPYPLISLTLLTLTHPQALSPLAITRSHRQPQALTAGPQALSPLVSSFVIADPEVHHRFVSHGHCFSLSLIFIF